MQVYCGWLVRVQAHDMARKKMWHRGPGPGPGPPPPLGREALAMPNDHEPEAKSHALEPRTTTMKHQPSTFGDQPSAINIRYTNQGVMGGGNEKAESPRHTSLGFNSLRAWRRTGSLWGCRTSFDLSLLLESCLGSISLLMMFLKWL